MRNRFLIGSLLLALTVLGAGCFGWGAKEEEQPEITKSVIEEAFEGNPDEFAVSSTDSEEPEAPKRWDVEIIRSKKFAFDPPAGYWVYLSTQDHAYWLVKGTPPEEGSEDPLTSAFEHRVAVIQPLTWDEENFSTWTRFELTMAQFNCVEGTTEENLVGCLDEPLKVVEGRTIGNLPYKKFALQIVRKVDQAPRGTMAFIIVRQGDASDHGVLITVEDDVALGAALELAKSMHVKTQ